MGLVPQTTTVCQSVAWTFNSILGPEKLPREWKYHRLLVVQWCRLSMRTPVYHSLHAMPHHHEFKYLYPVDKPPCSHLHAQKVDLPVILIVDLNLASVVQYSPFQFHLSLVHEFVIQIACSVWRPLPYALRLTPNYKKNDRLKNIFRCVIKW